jgi:hypothetical protein
MNKPNSKAIEKIVGVFMVVVFVSAFSSAVARPSDEQIAKLVAVEEDKQEAIEAEIQKQKAKIAELQLKKFSVQKTPFTDEDLAHLLEAVGFEGKALQVAWAVVKKESNGRPLAFNGNTRTGDSSYGIFQINMIGGLGVTRRDKYDLEHNKELFDPVVNAQIAYHMTNGGEVWTSWKVGHGYNGVDQVRFLDWYKKFPKGV